MNVIKLFSKETLNLIRNVRLFISAISLVILGYGCYSANSNSTGMKLINSKNFVNGKFVNPVPTNLGMKGKFWEMVFKYLA